MWKWASILHADSDPIRWWTYDNFLPVYQSSMRLSMERELKPPQKIYPRLISMVFCMVIILVDVSIPRVSSIVDFKPGGSRQALPWAWASMNGARSKTNLSVFQEWKVPSTIAFCSWLGYGNGSTPWNVPKVMLVRLSFCTRRRRSKRFRVHLVDRRFRATSHDLISCFLLVPYCFKCLVPFRSLHSTFDFDTLGKEDVWIRERSMSVIVLNIWMYQAV